MGAGREPLAGLWAPQLSCDNAGGNEGTLEDVVNEEAEGRRQVQLLDEPTERGIEGRWRLHRRAKASRVSCVTGLCVVSVSVRHGQRSRCDYLLLDAEVADEVVGLVLQLVLRDWVLRPPSEHRSANHCTDG